MLLFKQAWVRDLVSIITNEGNLLGICSDGSTSIAWHLFLNGLQSRPHSQPSLEFSLISKALTACRTPSHLVPSDLKSLNIEGIRFRSTLFLPNPVEPLFSLNSLKLRSLPTNHCIYHGSFAAWIYMLKWTVCKFIVIDVDHNREEFLGTRAFLLPFIIRGSLNSFQAAGTCFYYQTFNVGVVDWWPHIVKNQYYVCWHIFR